MKRETEGLQKSSQWRMHNWRSITLCNHYHSCCLQYSGKKITGIFFSVILFFALRKILSNRGTLLVFCCIWYTQNMLLKVLKIWVFFFFASALFLPSPWVLHFFFQFNFLQFFHFFLFFSNFFIFFRYSFCYEMFVYYMKKIYYLPLLFDICFFN